MVDINLEYGDMPWIGKNVESYKDNRTSKKLQTVWFVERMNDSQHILGSEELLFRLKVTEFLVNKNKKILISRYLVFKKANYRIL